MKQLLNFLIENHGFNMVTTRMQELHCNLRQYICIIDCREFEVTIQPIVFMNEEQNEKYLNGFNSLNDYFLTQSDYTSATIIVKYKRDA